MPLTRKQQRFVDEYLVDLNATQAAVRAGYSPRTANREGSRLLSNVDIQAAVAGAQEARRGRTRVDQDRVVADLVEVVERCMQRAPVLNTEGAQAEDAGGHYLWRFDGRTAVAALKLLGSVW